MHGVQKAVDHLRLLACTREFFTFGAQNLDILDRLDERFT